jgi:hypothetical protein
LARVLVVVVAAVVLRRAAHAALADALVAARGRAEHTSPSHVVVGIACARREGVRQRDDKTTNHMTAPRAKRRRRRRRRRRGRRRRRRRRRTRRRRRRRSRRRKNQLVPSGPTCLPESPNSSNELLSGDENEPPK